MILCSSSAFARYQLCTTRTNRNMSSKPLVYVIIGASRGIGLSFVQQLAERTLPTVYATVRVPDTATELNAYASKHSNVHVLKADLVSAESFVAAADEISKQVLLCTITNNFDSKMLQVL